MHEWFPSLTSYEKFNYRLNELGPLFCALLERLLAQQKIPGYLLRDRPMLDSVIDSMPIMLAKGSRADKAKVAVEIADKGKCGSKNLFYHGVKLHHLGLCSPGTMPLTQGMWISRASESDNTIFKEQIAPLFRNLRVYADKIYQDQAAAPDLEKQHNIHVFACQKRKPQQAHLHADQKQWNVLISRIRQPIESFFNWIQQKTGIHNAAQVRSTKGLMKHVFAKITAAMLIIIGI